MNRSCACAILLWAVIAGCGLSASSAVWAAEEATDREGAVSAARKAFAARGNIPWYDAKTDALRPVNLPGPPPFDIGWLFKPLFWMIVAIAGVALAIIVWVITWAMVRQHRSAPSKPQPDEPSVVTEGLEALSFLEDRPRNDLLGHARRHYEAGNYAEAIVYLFSYELFELDQNALVRLARGKTNRQYLREASQARPLSQLLERTMHAFEAVFFGGLPLDRHSFEARWNELSEFQSQIAAARGVS
jgi:hypothetical protein